MSEEFNRPPRSLSDGLMIAGHSAVTHAVRALDAALFSVEQAARGGIPPAPLAASMANIEADMRGLLARIEAVNAGNVIDLRSVA